MHEPQDKTREVLTGNIDTLYMTNFLLEKFLRLTFFLRTTNG